MVSVKFVSFTFSGGSGGLGAAAPQKKWTELSMLLIRRFTANNFFVAIFVAAVNRRFAAITKHLRIIPVPSCCFLCR